MKQLEALLLPLNVMLVHRREPPAFCQVALIRLYPFIRLGGEVQRSDRTDTPVSTRTRMGARSESNTLITRLPRPPFSVN